MTKQLPLISIVIPCYNSGNYLDEAVESILNQKYQNFEIIIIDDGSNDQKTVDILNNFNRQKTQIYRINNGGVSNARNVGINASKGKYILPLDADDKIGKNYINQAIILLEEDPELKLVYCNAEYFGLAKGSWKLPNYTFEGLLFQNLIFCSGIFRRSDFMKTEGYNVNMKEGLEDWDFWISFLKNGGKVHKIEEVGFYYRITPKSRSNSFDDKRDTLKTQIFKNHMNTYIEKFGPPLFVYDKYIQIKESESYKTGQIILSPLIKAKKKYLKNKK